MFSKEYLKCLNSEIIQEKNSRKRKKDPSNTSINDRWGSTFNKNVDIKCSGHDAFPE